MLVLLHVLGYMRNLFFLYHVGDLIRVRVAVAFLCQTGWVEYGLKLVFLTNIGSGVLLITVGVGCGFIKQDLCRT